MTAYIVITDLETDPEAPLTSELAKKWRDNPIATFEGATGAPRMVGAALKLFADYPVLTVAAADTVACDILCSGAFATTSTTGSTYVSAGTMTAVKATGTLRFKFTAAVSGSAVGSWQITKNGTVVNTFTSTGSKSQDIAVVPGDVIELLVKRTSGTAGETASVQAFPGGWAWGDESYVNRTAYTTYTARNNS